MTELRKSLGRNDIVFGSAIACILLVWLFDAFPNQLFLLPHFLAGFYLAVFPTGFLLLSALFLSKDEMSRPEWLGYSIGLSIAMISFGTFVSNTLFGLYISIGNSLRLVLALAVLFYTAGKLREML